MSESLARPDRATHHFRRVAILFAGGPAPGGRPSLRRPDLRRWVRVCL